MTSTTVDHNPHSRRKREAMALNPAPSDGPYPSAILCRRSTWLGLLATFVMSFALYASTCARTVTGEDSGELIAAAYELGVAHPPGYPTWCLLAKAATLVPIGEVAFRVALLSAFFGALTVLLIAAILLVLTASWPAALLSAFTFGLLRDQWSQATIAEVYTLNSFFLAACTLLLLLWSEKKSLRLFLLFAFTYGLSLSNHHTMLGAAPAFLFFLLVHGARKLREWRMILASVFCFVLGLLPYAYLPIAASRNPEMNWGDPRSLQGVLDHVTRRQYLDAETLPERSWHRFFDQLSVVVDAFSGQGATLVLICGIVSLLLLFRRRTSVALLLSGVAVVSSIGFILQTNVNVDFESAYASRLFHVPAWMMLTIAAGCLVADALARVPRKVATLVGSACVVLAVTPPAIFNLRECDYSNYRIVAAHARQLLMSVPGNAVLFPSSDHNTFPLIYMRFVEGVRKDVTIGDKYGYVDPKFSRSAPFAAGLHEKTCRSRPFREAVERWVIEELKRPVYFSSKGRAPDGYEIENEGIWYRARSRGTSRADLRVADDAAWAAVLATDLDVDPVPFDYSAKMVLSDFEFARARRLVAEGKVDLAIAPALRAAELLPRSKEVQNNIGSLLAEAGAFEEARGLFERAIAIDPTYATAVRNLGTALQAAGDADGARTAFRNLLLISPLDPSANRALAAIEKAAGNFGVAAVHLEELGKVTGDPFAFRDAGLIRLFELRELKRAKALLQTSLRIDRNQPDVAEVEAQIVAPEKKDEAAAKPGGARKPGDQDDHAHHDCNARGCAAKDRASSIGGLPSVRAPLAPNPYSAAIPKTGTPEVSPKVSHDRAVSPNRRSPR